MRAADRGEAPGAGQEQAASPVASLSVKPAAVVVGYLIPEFPGQTHVWMWREVLHLREWSHEPRDPGGPALSVVILGTRRPPARDRAPHPWADDAERETSYLWPRSPAAVLGAILRQVVTRPLGFARAAWLGMTLPVDGTRRRVLSLLAPACVLVNECRRLGVTHLHAQSAAGSAVLAMMVQQLAGVTYSVVVNADLRWWGGAMREKLGGAAFVVVHAAWLREQIAREFPEVAGRVLLAPVGVDTRNWPLPERPEPDTARLSRKPFRLVSVGRLVRGKGHDLLIEAVRLLVDRGRDVRLRIIGGGPEHEALSRRAAGLGVGDRVTLTGAAGEQVVRRELADADAFVLATREEALGVAFMEAMASGLPTIGTRVGGVPEVIADGEDGVLVPPDDPGAIAGAVERLMASPAEQRRLGRAGRAKIERAFDSRRGAAAVFEKFTGRPAPEGGAGHTASGIAGRLVPVDG